MESENIDKQINYAFAKKHGVLVKSLTDGVATIIYHKEVAIEVLAELQRFLQSSLHLEKVTEDEFQNALALSFESGSSSAKLAVEGLEENLDLTEIMHQIPTSEDLLDTQDDAPVIRLINALFTQAIKQKVSDIHIETYEKRVLVRMRLDGVLQEVLEIQRAIAPLVISRVKVMAKLDIAEKRIPQDGRISLTIANHKIDVRVSTMPSNHGERIVMRILDKKSAQLDLNLLGMHEDDMKKIVELIHNPYGIILVTGPTGSGKTTSLYAMLTDLNEVSRNILTIEDPIEYDLPGIGQTQVNTKVDMTFAKGLRAMLRQDPDVVMVGEIRDLETAEIAVQASLTGHLVLSTLHTNTALGAIARLNDMGVESFLLSSSLIGLIAQRLIRRLCPACKVKRDLSKAELKLMGLKEDNQHQIYHPQGCAECNQLGYRGRMGIYEVIVIDDELQGMIHRKESQQKIEKYVRKSMPSIREDGFRRVLEGVTSLDEILRVTSQN
jgi:general secretion pathway protein E